MFFNLDLFMRPSTFVLSAQIENKHDIFQKKY